MRGPEAAGLATFTEVGLAASLGAAELSRSSTREFRPLTVHFF
jgi:hypothetical protein